MFSQQQQQQGTVLLPALVLGVLMLLPWSVVSDDLACPHQCQCRKDDTSSFGFSATCSGVYSDLVSVVSGLSNKTTDFVFVVNTVNASEGEREQVDLNGDVLANLSRLKRLHVKPGNPARPYDYHMVDVESQWALCRMGDLQELRLNLDMLKLDSGAVGCLQGLRVLDLSLVRYFREATTRGLLAALPAATLRTLQLRHIQTLDNRGPIVRRLDVRGLFGNRTLEALEEVDVSFNAFTSLAPGLLAKMPRLKRLDVSENQLLLFGEAQTVAACVEVFLHPTLEVLIASKQDACNRESMARVRRLRRHPIVQHCFDQYPSVFDWISNSCDFIRCLLQDNDGVIPCEDLPNLVEHLDLTGCAFSFRFPIGRNLRQIHFSSNYEYQGGNTPVGSDTFCIEPDNSLEFVDLSDNNFASIVTNEGSVLQGTISGLVNLRVLNVSGNGVTVHNISTFGDFPSLRRLQFAGNHLALDPQVDEPVLVSTPNVTYLDLSGCGIEELPGMAFVNLASLQTLNLSQNRLQDIGIELTSLANLQHLNLSDNRLRSLSGSFRDQLDALPGLLSLDLTNNPLICACDTLDFVRWVQATAIWLVRKSDYQCDEQTLGRTALTNIDADQLHAVCHPPILRTAFVSTASTLTAIGLIAFAAVLYQKRYRLRYRLYRHYRVLPTRPEDEYEFDGFVVYNSGDRGWVHHPMREEMEGQRQLRLFIYLRDLLAGGDLAESLHRDMARCRKIILVLSPHFLQSDYCLYEAQIAHHQLLAEGRDVLVLVKIENLPLRGVVGIIANLLEMKECLEWTDDPDGQKLFWDKLEDELMTSPDYPLRR